MLEVIKKRKESEEYSERLHIALQAKAIIKVLASALAKQEISLEELIGKAPTKSNENAETISKWKDSAKQRGLKTNN